VDLDESGGGSKYDGGKEANCDGSFCSVEFYEGFDASAVRGVPRVGKNSVGARVVPEDGGFKPSYAMRSLIAACRFCYMKPSSPLQAFLNSNTLQGY
jgi:hypothetical protein